MKLQDVLVAKELVVVEATFMGGLFEGRSGRDLSFRRLGGFMLFSVLPEDIERFDRIKRTMDDDPEGARAGFSALRDQYFPRCGAESEVPQGGGPSALWRQVADGVSANVVGNPHNTTGIRELKAVHFIKEYMPLELMEGAETIGTQS